MKSRKLLYKFLFILPVFIFSCNRPESIKVDTVPEWSKGIVWYQIFPERFRNGDPSNDPTLQDQQGAWPHELLEPWHVHPWGSDWYELQPYEKSNGKDIWYNISRRRYGGDLQGIIDKLDYMKELGIGGIYLNPVFVSPSSHKYDIAYHHHIDPNFGPDPAGDRSLILQEVPDDPSTWVWTKADKLALKLIEEVHGHGIKIIFDGVFNHVGYNNFAFQDVLKNQQDSRFKDWFTVTSWRDTVKDAEFEYKGWWGVKDMPELREDSNGLVNGPRQYIFNITKRWMDPEGKGDPSKGIDGWRLDVAYEVAHPFWKDWRKLVRKINPEAYLTAEVIDTPQKLKAYLSGDEFDAVMNYNFDFICSEYFINDEKSISTSTFDSLLKKLRQPFTSDVNLAMQNLLGSHDTDRPSSRIKNYDLANFLDWAPYFDISKARNQIYKTRMPSPEDYRNLKLMVIFQMTYPGSPMIYYGDEVGMWGAMDPDCRKPMIWDDIEFSDEVFDAAGKTIDTDSQKSPDRGKQFENRKKVKVNLDLLGHYKKMIAIHNASPALRTGDFRTLIMSDDQKVFVFERNSGKEKVIVGINMGKELRGVFIRVEKDGTYTDLLNHGKSYSSAGMRLTFQVEPGWAVILRSGNVIK
jgi:cyclomaltodextrinase